MTFQEKSNQIQDSRIKVESHYSHTYYFSRFSKTTIFDDIQRLGKKELNMILKIWVSIILINLCYLSAQCLECGRVNAYLGLKNLITHFSKQQKIRKLKVMDRASNNYKQRIIEIFENTNTDVIFHNQINLQIKINPFPQKSSIFGIFGDQLQRWLLFWF